MKTKLSLKAVLPAVRVENAKVPTTPQVSSWTLVVVAPHPCYTKGGNYPKTELLDAITARFYFSGRDGVSPLRCALWIRTADGNHLSGSGSASGCGYHKHSAALQHAISSCGVKLYGRVYHSPGDSPKIGMKKQAYIDGVGDTAMADAMYAIAIAAGYRGLRSIVKG